METLVHCVTHPKTHESSGNVCITVFLTVVVKVLQHFDLIIARQLHKCFLKQPFVLELVFSMNHFTQVLESI